MIDSKSDHINATGQDITINRTPTSYTGKAIIGKVKNRNTDFTMENKRFINALLESNLSTGEIVACGTDNLLVVASKVQLVEGQAIAIVASAEICNATFAVTRDAITYDDYGNPTGSSSTTVIDAIPCFADVVTASMRMTNPGLLATTVLSVHIVNNTSLLLLDKATVAGIDYRVDVIDRFQIPGALVLQLSSWVG